MEKIKRTKITGGIDFYDEIEYPTSDDEIITVCLSKLIEMNKTQVAGLNSSDTTEERGKLRKHSITGNPES
jgi:hypothetical protein